LAKISKIIYEIIVLFCFKEKERMGNHIGLPLLKSPLERGEPLAVGCVFVLLFKKNSILKINLPNY